MPHSVARNAHIRGNDRSKRLVALAEEQAMEVIATLMAENDDDVVLMREIGARMRERPLSVTAEDDVDVRLLLTLKARFQRRIRKIAEQREVVLSIGKVAA